MKTRQSWQSSYEVAWKWPQNNFRRESLWKLVDPVALDFRFEKFSLITSEWTFLYHVKYILKCINYHVTYSSFLSASTNCLWTACKPDRLVWCCWMWLLFSGRSVLVADKSCTWSAVSNWPSQVAIYWSPAWPKKCSFHNFLKPSRPHCQCFTASIVQCFATNQLWRHWTEEKVKVKATRSLKETTAVGGGWLWSDCRINSTEKQKNKFLQQHIKWWWEKDDFKQ